MIYKFTDDSSAEWPLEKMTDSEFAEHADRSLQGINLEASKHRQGLAPLMCEALRRKNLSVLNNLVTELASS